MKKILLAGMLVLWGGAVQAAMTPDGRMIPVPEYDEAEILVAKGDFEAAMPLLLSTLRQYPTHASAWNLLGYMARKGGDLEKAEDYYERALLVNPAHLGALNYQGHLYMETGRPDKARENLERLGIACEEKCTDYLQLREAIETGGSAKYAEEPVLPRTRYGN